MGEDVGYEPVNVVGFSPSGEHTSNGESDLIATKYKPHVVGCARIAIPSVAISGAQRQWTNSIVQQKNTMEMGVESGITI